MSTESIVTIFTALAFGPAVAVVLLRWVLNRATLQDQRIESQAIELGQLRSRLDEMSTESRAALADRLRDSTAVEEKLVAAVDNIAVHAERLAGVVSKLEQRLEMRPCQLPEPVLCQVRRMLRNENPEAQ